MCSFDRETGKKVNDCNGCGCGQSSNSGNHNFIPTGEAVQVGNKRVSTYKCSRCGAYNV